LVLASTLFALYLGVANLVDFLGFLTLPLGNLGNSAVLSIIAVESAMMSLYICSAEKTGSDLAELQLSFEWCQSVDCFLSAGANKQSGTTT